MRRSTLIKRSWNVPTRANLLAGSCLSRQGLAALPPWERVRQRRERWLELAADLSSETRADQTEPRSVWPLSFREGASKSLAASRRGRSGDSPRAQAKPLLLEDGLRVIGGRGVGRGLDRERLVELAVVHRGVDLDAEDAAHAGVACCCRALEQLIRIEIYVHL